MYCPMKLYLKTHVDISQNNEYQLYNEIKNLKIDIQDLLQKNMRKLKKSMDLNEIETALSQNIAAYTENNIDTIKNLKLDITQEQIGEITDETYFNIKILSLFDNLINFAMLAAVTVHPRPVSHLSNVPEPDAASTAALISLLYI